MKRNRINNVVDFRNGQVVPEGEIKIPRSEKFDEIAKELSDFISALPLSQPDNDRLIKLIVQQINESESTAFCFGFEMGINLMSSEGKGSNIS